MEPFLANYMEFSSTVAGEELHRDASPVPVDLLVPRSGRLVACVYLFGFIRFICSNLRDRNHRMDMNHRTYRLILHNSICYFSDS